MADARPWIVMVRKAGQRTVYRFSTHAQATAKAHKLQREGHSPVMVFHTRQGY